jgi:hypothetical protein
MYEGTISGNYNKQTVAANDDKQPDNLNTSIIMQHMTI